jgi:transposase
VGAALAKPLPFLLAPEAEELITVSRRKLLEFERELAERREREVRQEEEIRQLRERSQQQKERIERLTDRNRRLESQLRGLLSSPLMLAASDRTAEAGGVPSSRVFYHCIRHRSGKRRPGGQRGHRGHARPRPIPNAPPMRLTLDRCRDCGTRLGEPCAFRRRVITELPHPQPLIFEVEIARYHCLVCRRKVEPEDPFAPHAQFGPLLTARVIHLRMLGLTVPKIAAYLEEAHGVPVSPAAILRMERHTAELFDPSYRKLAEELRSAPVVGADETGFRIGGANGWLWAFTHPEAVVYRIAGTRGHTVVDEMLGGYRGTVVRDGWKPYDGLSEAGHQLDLLHVNRWLEQAEVRHRVQPRPLLQEVAAKLDSAGRPPEEFLRFADRVRKILRTTVLWAEGHPDAGSRVRRRVACSAQRAMARHVREGWKDPDAARIAKELYHRRRMLFTFLEVPGVPFHNNDAESQVRQGVLYRKISGGRRSWTGAWVLERLLTVYRTCQKRGLEFIAILKQALALRTAVPLPARASVG